MTNQVTKRIKMTVQNNVGLKMCSIKQIIFLISTEHWTLIEYFLKELLSYLYKFPAFKIILFLVIKISSQR